MSFESHRNRAFKRYRWKGHQPIPATIRKKVMCVETGIVFNSLKEASSTMKISISSLSYHIRGSERHPSVQGYTFKEIINE